MLPPEPTLDLDAVVAQPAAPDPRPKQPLYGLSLGRYAVYRATWLVCRAISRLVFRTRATGLDNLDDGPLLLLSNHVGLLDPFWVGLPMWRPCRFMAATSVCDLPVLGPYLQALGAFPKMKGVKDPDSMRVLADHYDNRLVVTLFPEGVRTWTGAPMPIHDGIGRLIKRLNARVMFVQIRSGYQVMPRWAKYPRYVPLDLNYVGPVTYDASLSAQEIAADVSRHLSFEPTRDRSRFAAGFRLAEGLPQLLWACPVCHAQESLQVQGWRRRDVACSACSASWRLDIDAVLHGHGDTPSLSVRDAYEGIQAYFGDPPLLDRARTGDGVVARARRARLRHIQGRKGGPVVGQGTLQVHRDRLVLGADGQAFEIPFDQVKSVSVDVGSQVMVRCQGDTPRGTVYRLEVPDESALKWGSVLEGWIGRFKG